LILSALYSLALLAVGVDLSVLLGMISGTLEIIPYLGFIVGLSFSLLMTTLQFQDILHPLSVLILFSVIQTAQGFFISPKVIGRQVGIHPLVVIAAITIGGDLFGLVGVLLAIPCAAVLLVVLKALVRAFKASSFFNVPPVGE
jgi:predicted PurR-regulated permease PerM